MLTQLQHSRQRHGHSIIGRDRRKVDEYDPVDRKFSCDAGDFNREARFSDAANSGQGYQPVARDEGCELGHFPFSSDEARQRVREVVSSLRIYERRHLLAQNLALQGLELRAGIDA